MGAGADNVKAFSVLITYHAAAIMCRKFTIYYWIQAGEIKAAMPTDIKLRIATRSFCCFRGGHTLRVGLPGLYSLLCSQLLSALRQEHNFSFPLQHDKLLKY